MVVVDLVGDHSGKEAFTMVAPPQQPDVDVTSENGTRGGNDLVNKPFTTILIQNQCEQIRRSIGLWATFKAFGKK